MAVCCLLKICSILEEFNVKWFCQQCLAPPWAMLGVCSEMQFWNILGKQSLLHCLAWGICTLLASLAHSSHLLAVILRRTLIVSGLSCRIALEIYIFFHFYSIFLSSSFSILTPENEKYTNLHCILLAI